MKTLTFFVRCSLVLVAAFCLIFLIGGGEAAGLTGPLAVGVIAGSLSTVIYWLYNRPDESKYELTNHHLY